LYAVFETGGKQYRVTEGDVVFLERLKGETGDDVIFDKVLACSGETETDFGSPYLYDASVEARILGHGKDKKIVVFKYKAKKGYRKKQGHRQPYTKVRIERIISEKFGVAAYGDDPGEADELPTGDIPAADYDAEIETVNAADNDTDDLEASADGDETAEGAGEADNMAADEEEVRDGV